MNAGSEETKIPSAAKVEREDTAGLRGASVGVSLIAAERQRQISVEGWTPEHDDAHAHAEMANAAACYAWAVRTQAWGGTVRQTPPPIHWPWADEWWKPSPDPIRNLEKAGR